MIGCELEENACLPFHLPDEADIMYTFQRADVEVHWEGKIDGITSIDLA